MKNIRKDFLYSAGLAVSFVLGMWFSSGRSPSTATPRQKAPEIAVLAQAEAQRAPEPAPGVEPSPASRPGTAHIYSLVATDPRGAMDEAMKLPDAMRLPALQNLLAVWLRNDRLAAAEWMTERRGLREFEPLSAQVSDAFFPDDTEMSAMFSFDLSDAKLRDVRVNRLVAYWKSGAHLKFDNSPWEVDGPASSPAKTEPAPVPAPQPETASAEPAGTETIPKS